MSLIPVPQNSDLVVLVLVEVKPVGFSILELQEVVIQTLLADPHLLSSLFQRLTVSVVELPPFLNFLNDFSDLALLGTAAALALGFLLLLLLGLMDLLGGSVPDLKQKSLLVHFVHYRGVVAVL